MKRCYTIYSLLSLLVLVFLTSCSVMRIDYNTLPEEDKQKLLNQRYNSHVRIQSGWINNPWYWDNGYYGNWNGWWNWNRFQSPAIIIKRQPNKRYDYNRNRNRPRPNNQPNRRNITPNGNNTRNINPVRGSRGSSNSVNRQPIRQKTKPQLPTRLRQGRGGKKQH